METTTRLEFELITNELTTRVWNALKNKCAADPEKAQRLVMVTESDIAFAVRKALEEDLVDVEKV